MTKPSSEGRTRVRAILYRDIACKLRSRITSGRYRPNDKLPSLADLVDEFQASAISVRRALRELAYEGLVHGEQGRGVFVRAKGVIHRVLATDAERSIGDEIERAGFKPTIRELKYERVGADEETARRLEVAPGASIRRHQKLVSADAEPVSLHFLHFADAVAPRLEPHLAHAFVFPMLKRARFRVARTRFEFAAMALSTDHSALFGKPAGFPMGVLHFTPLERSGKPILTGTTLFRSDRFVFDLDVAQGE
jgi:DNA-binding GntR family transcriptional regulator